MPSRQAKQLYGWLEDEWAARGITMTAWCREAGISNTTVLRWREGTEPDLRTLRIVADKLERSLVDVLLAAGYIYQDEVDGYEIPTRYYDIVETIRLDPDLSDEEREALRQIHDAFALVESGRKRKVKVRGRTR